ncbi:MAG: hypothetical protein EXR79_14290 [Myxococcales bacterium]|nr:hypothetical protein [Myxococcales bacterium]
MSHLAFPDAADCTALVIANPAERAARWRLHHAQWGDGFDEHGFLRREQALGESDVLRDRLRMWLLVDGHGQALASCETWTTAFVHALPSGHQHHLRGEVVASVLVEPRLRHRGYALGLLVQLTEAFAREGVAVSTLYSDVGAVLYRRAGWLLHAARETVVPITTEHPWPEGVAALSMGEVADVLKSERERTAMWLLEPVAPTVVEVLDGAKVAWHWMRAQHRAWARGEQPSETVGARGKDGGFALWAAQAAQPRLDVLAWRPNGQEDAATLTAAALACAAACGLAEVTWWDADRETGTGPWRRPALRPTAPAGITAHDRDRQAGLPMLRWSGSAAELPLVWGGIERAGWM